MTKDLRFLLTRLSDNRLTKEYVVIYKILESVRMFVSIEFKSTKIA